MARGKGKKGKGNRPPQARSQPAAAADKAGSASSAAKATDQPVPPAVDTVQPCPSKEAQPAHQKSAATASNESASSAHQSASAADHQPGNPAAKASGEGSQPPVKQAHATGKRPAAAAEKSTAVQALQEEGVKPHANFKAGQHGIPASNSNGAAATASAAAATSPPPAKQPTQAAATSSQGAAKDSLPAPVNGPASPVKQPAPATSSPAADEGTDSFPGFQTATRSAIAEPADSCKPVADARATTSPAPGASPSTAAGKLAGSEVRPADKSTEAAPASSQASTSGAAAKQASQGTAAAARSASPSKRSKHHAAAATAGQRAATVPDAAPIVSTPVKQPPLPAAGSGDDHSAQDCSAAATRSSPAAVQAAASPDLEQASPATQDVPASGSSLQRQHSEVPVSTAPGAASAFDDAEPSDVAGGSSGQTKQAQLAQHADRPAGSKQYADVACAPTQEEVEAGVAGEPDPPEGWYATLKRHAKALKRSVLALYYATQDPDVGWLPKFLAMFALAYALSPMDLIPDFIPVLGLLDDLLLLPGLIWLAIRLIPDEAWQRAKARADTEPVRLRENWVAAALMFALWDGLAVLLAHVITRKYGNRYWRHHDWIVMLIVGGTMALVEISWIIWRLWADHAGQQVKLTAEGPLAEPLLGEGRAAEENA